MGEEVGGRNAFLGEKPWGGLRFHRRGSGHPKGIRMSRVFSTAPPVFGDAQLYLRRPPMFGSIRPAGWAQAVGVPLPRRPKFAGEDRISMT